ncbi:hypothetical protein VTI74DRAFT_10026 [Chaetomium olivicolor]
MNGCMWRREFTTTDSKTNDGPRQCFTCLLWYPGTGLGPQCGLRRDRRFLKFCRLWSSYGGFLVCTTAGKGEMRNESTNPSILIQWRCLCKSILSHCSYVKRWDVGLRTIWPVGGLPASCRVSTGPAAGGQQVQIRQCSQTRQVWSKIFAFSTAGYGRPPAGVGFSFKQPRVDAARTSSS